MPQFFMAGWSRSERFLNAVRNGSAAVYYVTRVGHYYYDTRIIFSTAATSPI
ncbi:MAG: hypothetical protein ACLSGI_08660 [Butyricicoccaceae bacterium]